MLAAVIAVVVFAASCATDSARLATTDGSTATIAPSTTTATSWTTAAPSQSTNSITTTVESTTITSTPPTIAPPVTPPKLEILDPEPGSVLAAPSYVFRGVTDPGCLVDVGGKYYAEVDEEGNWWIELMLRPGGNATTFTATDEDAVTSVARISVHRRLTLSEIVGEWIGEAVVPEPWTQIGDVWFHFRADGTFSVRNRALYWGDDFDSPNKTYEVWEADDPTSEAIEGAGRIALTWDISGTHRFARMETLVFDGDRLYFELWDRDHGPIEYELTRAPQDHCVNDPYERNDVWPGTRIGHASWGDVPRELEALLCPGDEDLYRIGAYFHNDCPIGSLASATMTVEVSAAEHNSSAVEVVLWTGVSTDRARPISSLSVAPGETARIEHPWTADCPVWQADNGMASFLVQLSGEESDHLRYRLRYFVSNVSVIEPSS
jgi:hypothetical protein